MDWPQQVVCVSLEAPKACGQNNSVKIILSLELLLPGSRPRLHVTLRDQVAIGSQLLNPLNPVITLRK